MLKAIAAIGHGELIGAMNEKTPGASQGFAGGGNPRAMS